MRTFKVLLLFTFGFLLLYSCSTNRQLYISGYKTSNKIEKEDSKQYASKKNSQNKSDSYRTDLSLDKVLEEENSNNFDNHLSTSTDNDLSFLTLSSNHKLDLKPKKDNECDEIILKNGDELRVKVIEIAETIIKYRRCDNLNGPIYSIPKADVFLIKYPNGTRDVFVENDNEKNASSQGSPEEESEALVDKKSEQDKKDKVNREKKPKKGSGLGTASFIFALLGLINLIIAMASPIGLLFTIMCLLLSLASLITGIVGVSKSNTTWGKVGSIIGIIISTTLMIFVILAFLAL